MLGKLSFSLPAKKIAKLHIHLSKSTRKQLKKLKKYSDPLVLYGPKATKAPKKAK